MIQISNLSKSFGDQLIFEDISFSMVAGERLGIIGRNGSGKSTLFRLITDEEHPDEGEIIIPRGYRVGHLTQHLNFTESSILAEACLGLQADERDHEYKGEIILSGLGFSDEDLQRSPSEFSGGFQIRVNLAKVLLSNPNLLLLDEPTNYLDIVSARWLSGFLSEWPNEMMIITHDRDFMDSVSTHTMMIRRAKIRKIPGSSSKLINQLAVDDEIYENSRINEGKKRKEVEEFINRFRAKASKARQVQSKIKALEKMEIKEELVDDVTLDFEFSSAPFHGKALLEVERLTFGYDDAPLIKDLSFTLQKGERVGVIGKNGRGKSTLLKLLAGELIGQSGRVRLHSNAKLGFFGQTNISRLNPSNTVEEEIQECDRLLHRTKVRGICGTMMFPGDAALKQISVLSGGERSRVLIGKILATPTNLLLLDEPTNHLDIESIEALIESLDGYEGGIAIVTHDERILRKLATKLVVFRAGSAEVIPGDYDYFLKKIGWEEDELPNAPKTGSNVSKIPERSERDRENRPPSKNRLKMIEKEILDTESLISALEEKLRQAKADLLIASQAGDTSKVSELGVSIVSYETQIEVSFGKLEELTKERG